jgi:hypothetical protein
LELVEIAHADREPVLRAVGCAPREARRTNSRRGANDQAQNEQEPGCGRDRRIGHARHKPQNLASIRMELSVPFLTARRRLPRACSGFKWVVQAARAFFLNRESVSLHARSHAAQALKRDQQAFSSGNHRRSAQRGAPAPSGSAGDEYRRDHPSKRILGRGNLHPGRHLQSVKCPPPTRR